MPLQVGFVMRLEGQRLSAAVEDYLPDYEFAFEGNGGEVGGIYYHTDRTRQLNAHFGDMLHKIQDLEVSRHARDFNAGMYCIVSYYGDAELSRDTFGSLQPE